MNLSKGAFSQPSQQASIIRADLILWADAAYLGNSIFSELRNISVQPWWLISFFRNFIANLTRKALHIVSELKLRIQKLRGAAKSSRNTNVNIALPPQLFGNALTGFAEALPVSEQGIEMFDPPFQEFAAEISKNVDTVILPTLMPRFNGNKEQALRHALVDFQTAVALERSSRFLFGSQIDALILLGASGGRGTREELLNLYNAAIVKYPDIYVSYSFDEWLSFLQNQGLVFIDHETVAFQPAGKVIITYMQTRGYLQTRAPG